MVLTHVVKIRIDITETVDGSNESLDHADDELDTLLTNHLPSQ